MVGAYKGMDGANTNGYDVYDLYDLHEKNIQVYVDVVLNHKGGADEEENIQVIRVDPENRNQFTGKPLTVSAHTKFTFPGRQGRYSNFIWDYRCFSGVDYAKGIEGQSVLSIVNEYGNDWEEVSQHHFK